MKYVIVSVFFAAFMVLSIAGFRGAKGPGTPFEIFPDMDRQPKVHAQTTSEFWADGSASRLPVAGTVPRGAFVEDGYKATGRFGANWGDGIPVLIDEAAMARGKEVYDINCAICHGPAGDGQGVVAKVGWVAIANLQSSTFIEQPDGQIYNTIVYGKGNMNGYGANIKVDDRWKVVAYLRALQRSQNASFADLPAELQERLNALRAPKEEAGETTEGEEKTEESSETSSPGPTASLTTSLTVN